MAWNHTSPFSLGRTVMQRKHEMRHQYGVMQFVPSDTKITGRTRITKVTQYTYSMPNYTSQRLCWRKLRKQNLRD